MTRPTAHSLADLTRRLCQNPNNAWALAQRAELYRLAGQYVEALADLNRAIAVKPDYGWALAHRGVLYQTLGSNEQALVDFTQALRLNPAYVWALINRGLTLLALRRYAEAIADFDAVTQIDPTAIAHWWPSERGLVLNFSGRYGEAIACCEALLQQNAQDRMARYSLLVAQSLTAGVEAAYPAMVQMQSALQAAYPEAANNKEAAQILYYLGGLMALRGDHCQALHYLEATIPLYGEPMEQAQHDPAWDGLRTDVHFQALASNRNHGSGQSLLR